LQEKRNESPVSLVPDSIGSGELVSQWTDDYIGDTDIQHPDSVYYDTAISSEILDHFASDR